MSAPAAADHLDLPLEGMTCAACAARIERTLNRLDGVSASVNYATEQAAVDYDPRRVSSAELVRAVERAGYRARLPDAGAQPAAGAADPLDALRLRLVVSTVLAAPVVLLSMVPALQLDGWQWLSLALTTPVVLWGGWPFHRAAFQNLRHRAATMDTLVSLGTLVAYTWSVAALVFGSAGELGMRMQLRLVGSPSNGTSELYLEVAAGVTVFLLAGRFFEARARRRGRAALTALLELGAKQASRLDDDGTEHAIPVEALAVGERFLVRPGERIATDGVVEEGRSAVDRSLLTGESMPQEVEPGSSVTGATVNLGGRLVVRATRVGADTALAQIGRLVTQAQTGKAPVQRLADRVSAIFVPAVLVLAALTLAAWLARGESGTSALAAAVAVLIVACPCALGLATPTALLVGTGRGAQLGLVIRGPEVLETTRRIDTVVLDKTGTVTTGRMSVVEVVAAEGASPSDVLWLAGGLEHASQHPVARAIAAAATAERGGLAAVDAFRSRDGLGISGTVAGRRVMVGRPALLAADGLLLPPELERVRVEAEHTGRTAVAVAWDGAARGVVVLADALKPTSAEAVAELAGLGLTPVLVTGDNEATARAVATAVGIDEVLAGVLPHDKARVVRDLQGRGRVVAMVGDGVNDAPALAQADLGLAIGTGTDVAIEASDITLVSGDLRSAADAIRLARRTLRTIHQNLFWAFAYNVAALPLAAAGYLSPLLAGAAMACSSVFVVANSLRLRRFQTRR